MNLKQLLKMAGVRNDIAAAVEKKKLTDEQELKIQEEAMAMTKMILNDALRYRKEHGGNTPPSEPKKTIIMPDDK
jgi:hypothetical protein